MHERVMEAGSHGLNVALELLETTMGNVRTPFAVRLWDGTLWSPTPHSVPRFTLVLHHPASLRRMFLPLNQLSLGSAYVYGDFDIEGDRVAAFDLADALLDRTWRWRERLALGRLLLQLPAPGRHEGGGLSSPVRSTPGNGTVRR